MINDITINPIDSDGEFEIEMWDDHTYLTTEEAKQLIDYLTKSINAR